jgi:xanthine dehydrogenase accessory factor
MLENPYRIASRWLGEGCRVVEATLVRAEGSSPLDVGATMLIDDQGRIEGSVTGGCVEGALVEEALAILNGAPASLRSYGYSDEAAADVGLMCGGTVHVFVHELDSALAAPLVELAVAIEEGSPAAVAILLDGERAGQMSVHVSGVHSPPLDASERLARAVERDIEGLLDHGNSMVRRYGVGGETMGSDVAVFIHVFATAPRMVIFGAIDFSATVARLAKQLGYRVTICDAREAFVAADRFRVADEIVIDWPDRCLSKITLDHRDVVLVFTHDRKFDEPAIMSALQTDVGYLGALGSVRTHEDRRRRLLEAGAAEEDLARIASPCGLDIGARTPEETALSIVAEIVARRTGREGGPLTGRARWIHPRHETESQTIVPEA